MAKRDVLARATLALNFLEPYAKSCLLTHLNCFLNTIHSVYMFKQVMTTAKVGH